VAIEQQILNLVRTGWTPIRQRRNLKFYKSYSATKTIRRAFERGVVAMRKLFSGAAVALSFLGAGCAIHPLPEDVTGVTTYHIVRQIRCEARETIKQEVINWINLMAAAGYRIPQDLALKYQNDPEAVSTFHYDVFKGPEYAAIRSVAKLFYDTGIAYNFDLTMTENNDLSAGLTFNNRFVNPVVTLGIGAGAKRRRSNYRSFTVTDTFSYLLTKLNVEVQGQHYCDGHVVQANYVYPIAGRIGIDRMVHDFIELTLFASLREPHAKAGSAGAPTMADELSFTTALSGSVTPTAVFTPVSNAFQLTNATLTAGADRTDLHKVAVGLAIDTKGLAELDPLRSFLFTSDRQARATGEPAVRSHAATVLVGRRVTGGARTRAEALAVLAIDQLKSRELQLIPPP